MMVKTELGAIRLTAPALAKGELTANESAWIAMLRESCGGSIPPLTLAAVQALRRVSRKGS